jgi:hypothetical protein
LVNERDYNSEDPMLASQTSVSGKAAGSKAGAWQRQAIKRFAKPEGVFNQ